MPWDRWILSENLRFIDFRAFSFYSPFWVMPKCAGSVLFYLNVVSRLANATRRISVEDKIGVLSIVNLLIFV